MSTTDRFAKMSDLGAANNSGVSALSPDKLTGVKCWLDMTDLASVTTDTSLRVSQVNDKSGNGFHLTQAVAGSRPDFILQDADNTMGALWLNNFRSIGNTALTLSLPYTIYVYVKQNSYAGNGAVLVDFGAGQLNGIAQKPNADIGTHGLLLCAGTQWTPNQSSFSRIGEYALYKFSLDASGNSISSCNDEPTLGDDDRFGTFPTGTATIAKLLLGGGPIDAYIQELVLLDHVVSTDEHEGIVSYFMTKFNAASTVPMYVFGDSIAAGGHASVVANQWANLVSVNKNLPYYGFAVTSTNIGFGQAYGQYNLNALYNTVSINQNRAGWIIISYGTNEANAPTAAYKDYLENIVRYFIKTGYTPQQIILVSQLYNPSNTYIGVVAGYMATMVADLNVKYAPCYEYGVLHTVSDSLLDGTGHPNDAGHAAMASIIEATIG